METTKISVSQELLERCYRLLRESKADPELADAIGDELRQDGGWEECGECGGSHPFWYVGDCRDDRFRA